MRLPESNITVDTLGAGKEEEFTIGNMALAISILRDKLYSHPIKAIAREISSNARDAHREAGTPDLPIEIRLPSGLSPHFVVKDFGLGISPNRMSDIFVKYCNSTKRNDDSQTGMFGIGSKTPFSYTDQFNIVTITEENGKNIKRSYIAYIDPSNAGKMRLVAEQETDQHTGTEIIIPVRRENFADFKDAVQEVCNYWTVRPNVSGVDWKDNKTIIEGKDWKIFERECYNSKQLAVIDGIAYPIDLSAVNMRNDYTFNYVDFIVYFNIGELHLSANREQLNYDEFTTNAICDKISNIKQDVKNKIQSEIKGATTYVDAVKLFRKVKSGLNSFVNNTSDISWNNIPLVEELSIKDSNSSIRKYSNNENSYVVHNFKVYKTILINDLDRPGNIHLHVKTLLENKSSVFVFTTKDICKTKQHFKDALEKSLYSNSKYDYSLGKNVYSMDVPLEHLDILFASAIKPAERKKYEKGAKSTTNAYIFNSKYNDCLEPTKVEFSKGSGIYIFVSGHKKKLTSNDRELTSGTINYLKDKFNISDVYAIRESDKSRLGSGWTPLWSYVEKNVGSILNGLDEEALSNAMYIAKNVDQFYLIPAMERRAEGRSGVIGELKRIMSELDQDNILRKAFELKRQIIETYNSNIDNYKLLTLLRKNFGEEIKEDHELKSMCKEVEEKYPLLFASFNINYYSAIGVSTSNDKYDRKHLVNYVKAMDIFHSLDKEITETQDLAAE